jgi:hypothetical protein
MASARLSAIIHESILTMQQIELWYEDVRAILHAPSGSSSGNLPTRRDENRQLRDGSNTGSNGRHSGFWTISLVQVYQA